ncbi:Oxidation resistance protein 1 [Thelohanellus kitauei]|uniref:Oxidation resistance protein 1 n=1 Tax=Thelohanellus kitauei TaxID=669202 RepID=A0A0C2JB13_THEKT|nr:Oxidation resistance protein 1 [Thelohanellus kitauei]
MNFLSWVYESIGKLALPWGMNHPVDHFDSFLLVNNILITGTINLFSSKSDARSGDFEYLQFVDNLPPEQRDTIDKNVKFYIHLSDFREIAFFDTLDFLESSKISPIDPTLLKIDSGSSNDKTDAISSSNLFFCRILTRIAKREDDESQKPYCTTYKSENGAVFCTYVFGLSIRRSVFMLESLRRLCPFMNVDMAPRVEVDPITKENDYSESDLLIQRVIKTSNVLCSESIRKLIHHLPERSQVQDIILVYSTLNHGSSLQTLYRFSSQLTSSKISPPMFLVAIKDFDSTIFGAVISDSPYPSNRYYGNGESFVYCFKDDELKVYKWSGKNEYFQMGTSNSFSIGCDQGHCAIWLDGDLLHGHSQPCNTFDSPQLTKQVDFKCKVVELWSFSIY